MAPSLSDSTDIKVSMPIKVWIAGILAFITMVSAVTLVWADLRAGQQALKDRQASVETTLERTAHVLSDTVQALAELRGEFRAVRK